jgi:hypothetical protein
VGSSRQDRYFLPHPCGMSDPSQGKIERKVRLEHAPLKRGKSGHLGPDNDTHGREFQIFPHPILSLERA